MELVKAIEELKRIIEENNRLLLPHNEQFFNKKEKQEIRIQNIAISTVLQALDNSIPKEKVEENIRVAKQTPRREFCNYDDYTFGKIRALEELLEE